MTENKQTKLKGLGILGIIWFLGALCDRLWFALDRTTPGWDQAEYLTGSLNYWQALQNPQLFSGEWWTSFWLLSSKIPPLTYIIAGIFQNIFGTGEDKATLVHLLFSAILLASVYGLGVLLFSIEVGLWAAALCQLLPGLYQIRLQFVLDFPLTAFVTLSFFCLTVWYFSYKSPKTAHEKIVDLSLKQWFWAVAFGISLGLALLTKQTAIFFIFVPILWSGIGTIKQRAWGRLAQLIASLLLSVMIFGPWYRTNWLIVLTAGKRATVDSAIAEGDPGLNTLKAWTFYWHQLPYQISWPLLLVPIVGLILYWLRQNKFLNRLKSATEEPKVANTEDKFNSSKWLWLFVFWIGAYLLSSLNINKDTRYVVPYLPVFTLFLAYGLSCWTGRWVNPIRWGTVSLAALLMCLNLFPIGTGNLLTPVLSPQGQHYADLNTQLPHTQVIKEIIQTEPYLRSTLGVLPSTGIINQHNFNYYGALQNFQVYGRQVGTRQKYVPQDARSLSWFLIKTGEQGPVPKEAQSAIVQIIEQSPDFQLQKNWNLPDNSTLKLYHSKTPPIQVKPLSEPKSKVNLDQVIFPPKAPPGQPVPVTYYWSGSWEQLQSGLVLLTWKPALESETKNSSNSKSTENQKSLKSPTLLANIIQNPKSKIQNPRSWLHDRAIGMGTLHPQTLPANRSASGFQVIEQTAMLPTADILPGNYTLEATYLNGQTGETYNIPVPAITLKIDSSAIAIPAPELDLVTQLRNLATTMPLGADALGKVFEQIGRINQYDPTQDYLRQAQLTLAARLQAEPQNRDWAYALALSKILKRDVPGAIAALERVTQIDSQNPYSYGYLAFVHLYNWHPHAADSALKSALALNSNIREIKILSGVSALMQGNVFKAWQILQEIRYLK